jgi:hypothetical protein
MALKCQGMKSVESDNISLSLINLPGIEAENIKVAVAEAEMARMPGKRSFCTTYWIRTGQSRTSSIARAALIFEKPIAPYGPNRAVGTADFFML